MRIVPYCDLAQADLVIDAVYEGRNLGGVLDDPLCVLMPGCGNQSGFRHVGRGPNKKYIVLYTSGEEKDWPDKIELTTGRFTYFGDNRNPGHELHETPRGGNRILRDMFAKLHSVPPARDGIPPVFIFSKFATMNSPRSVQFKGLAIPGFPGLAPTDDLVAVWKTTQSQRFQNYRSVFTIVNEAVIKREWITDLANGKVLTANTPTAWNSWVQQGKYIPLHSEPTTIIRDQDAQSPKNNNQTAILQVIYEHFKDEPHKFEAFSATIFQFHDSRVIIDEITRASVDGGRDAIGRYSLGLETDPVYAEFSLEAKCYRPPINGWAATSVGTKEVARLISRIRHREFGVLVTTSIVARQAYQEVRQDQHPIIFLCGRDIAEILTAKGYSSASVVKEWLNVEFPV